MSVGLNCPHNQPVDFIVEDGLTVYVHESSNAPCDYLNQFTVNLSHIGLAQIGPLAAIQWENVTPAVRAVFNSLPLARIALYRFMSEVDDRVVLRSLITFCAWLISQDNSATRQVLFEMINTFGLAILRNLEFVMHRAYIANPPAAIAPPLSLLILADHDNTSNSNPSRGLEYLKSHNDQALQIIGAWDRALVDKEIARHWRDFTGDLSPTE